MSFVIQRPSGRGFALTQIREEVLRIGRGTNAELRSENPAVALEHAIIEADAAGWTVIDKGSITGTYVSGRPVEAARLSRGDVIEIGDLRIEVQTADPGKPMFLRVSSTDRPVAYHEEQAQQPAKETTPRGGALRAPEIDFAGAYRLARPYFTRMTVIAVLMIVALIAVSEVTQPENANWFMPGGVSSAHSRARDRGGKAIANQCRACHNPWQGVSSDNCKDCHAQGPHAKRESDPPGCVDCHAEHRQAAKLAAIGDSACVACHRDLRQRVIGSEPPAFPSVTSFATDHPEFRAHADNSTLRFNHKLHLQQQGIFNATGRREVLACDGCHRLVTIKQKNDPAPVDFERHCQRCHRLTFDARYPDAEVPHGGDPGLVYGAVFATYSGSADIARKSPEEVRRLLAARRITAPDQRAYQAAEQVIKAKCALCHEIRREGTRLVATPPVMPTQWIEHAKFTHTPHRGKCESCHDRASGSTSTSDLLLPGRAACTECHGNRETKASSCLTCHEYHGRAK